jgi:uncharacterized protein YecE (DUF72 family)
MKQMITTLRNGVVPTDPTGTKEDEFASINWFFTSSSSFIIMFHIGTSGWYYEDWVGEFYPEGISKKEWLGYYSNEFETVEVNASFYRVPFENMVKGWRDRTPDDFIFSFKGNRGITHRKRLREVEEDIERFMGRISLLGDKLGPVLWQFPPGLKRNDELLEGFISQLQDDNKHVIEFRNKSWFDNGVYSLLEKYGICLCVISGPKLPEVLEETADFSYIRWHGKEHWYNWDYSEEELRVWAERINELGVKDVYGYFNNDVGGFAVKNCKMLKEKLMEMP